MTDNGMSVPSVPDIDDIFSQAQVDPNNPTNAIGPRAAKILIKNLNGITAQGAAGPTKLSTDSVTIELDLIDMSISMDPVKLALIDAFNAKNNAFRHSKSSESIVSSAWFFNHESNLWYSYQRMKNVPDLTSTLYVPNGSTALYDTFLDAMVGLVAYVTALKKTGTNVTIMVFIYTDGDDTASSKTATAVKTVVDDLTMQEIFNFVLVAFGHGIAQNVAQPMGIRRVIESGATEHEIRATVDLVSQSVLQVSTGQITGGSVGKVVGS